MRKVRLEHQRVLAQKIAGEDGHRIARIGELYIPAEIFARLFRDAAVEAFQLDVLIAQPLKVGALQNMCRPARLVLCRDELQLGVTTELGRASRRAGVCRTGWRPGVART